MPTAAIKRRRLVVRRRLKRKRTVRRRRGATQVLRSLLEKKTHRTALNGVAVSGTSAGQYLLCNGISQGDTVSTREGRKLNPVSLQLRGRWLGADSPYNVCMVFVVWMPKTCSVSEPTFSEIWDLNSTTAAHLEELMPIRNKNYLHKYRILWKKTFPMRMIAGSSSDYNNVRYFSRTINLRGKVTRYDGSTSGVTDITAGGLWVGYLSDSEAVSHPSLDLISHFNYYDL